MIRSLRILLATLLCVLAVQPPVVSSDDLQGGGGVVVIPFAANATDVRVPLGENMRGSVILCSVGGSWTNLAYMSGTCLILDGDALRQIHGAGVTEFLIFVVSPTGQIVRIEVRFDPGGGGSGTVSVYS